MVTLKKSKGLIIPDIICINLAVILSFYVIYEGNIPQNIKDNFLCCVQYLPLPA